MFWCLAVLGVALGYTAWACQKWLHFQPKEYRIIYLYSSRDKCLYPLTWPSTYAELVTLVEEHLGQTFQDRRPKLFFKDAHGIPVCVESQSTFEGLVPLQRKMEPLCVYSVALDL